MKWRKIRYDVLFFPNKLFDFAQRLLQLCQIGYNFVIWGGVNEALYLRPNHQERLSWLRENAKGKILELGCSTGYIIDLLDGQVGLDMNRRRLSRAKCLRVKDHLFIEGLAQRLPFAYDSFDTVLIPEILEHIPFQTSQEIVQEAVRVGYQVLITIPRLPKYKNHPEHLWIPVKEEIMDELLAGLDYEVSKSLNEDYFLAKVWRRSKLTSFTTTNDE